MNNLSQVYSKQGRYEESERLFTECYEIQKEILGNNHPDTLTTMELLQRVESSLVKQRRNNVTTPFRNRV